MMKKFTKYVASLFAILMLGGAIAPPIAYASEAHYQTQALIADNKTLSIDEMIEINKYKYPGISESRMREIANLMLSPYSTRANSWDGKGVTLADFAWAFDFLVSQFLPGGIFKAIKNMGLRAAKQELSRVAKRAFLRFGVWSGLLGQLIGAGLNYINLFYNVGYSLARYIDSRDYYPNNGRINAWR